MKIVTRTDIGNVMANNQDSFLVVEGPYPVYAVADGMGGHKGGHVASQMALQAIQADLKDHTPNEDTLRKSFIRANREIFARQRQEEDISGMGTTLTVLWQSDEGFYLGHVGDSRCYLMRQGTLTQMSTDHSLVAELVRDGVLAPEQADEYPYRNVITRAVGTNKNIHADITWLDRQPGDRWLLCTDGLTEYIKAPRLRDILSTPDLSDAADCLLNTALDMGGRDNITLILLEVEA